MQTFIQEEFSDEPTHLPANMNGKESTLLFTFQERMKTSNVTPA